MEALKISGLEDIPQQNDGRGKRDGPACCKIEHLTCDGMRVGFCFRIDFVLGHRIVKIVG